MNENRPTEESLDIQPYASEGAPCAKCGHESTDIKFCKGEIGQAGTNKLKYREWLNRKCKRCRYEWNTETRDAGNA